MNTRRTRDSSDDDRGGRGRDDDRGGRARGDEGGGRGQDADRASRGDRPGSRGGDSVRGFSYQRRSSESVRKRADASSKDFDTYIKEDVKMFKPNSGSNTIRILPPMWPEPDHYGLDLHVHYGIGSDEDAYLCLKKMKGEDCPICEERDRAKRAGEDEEYIKSLEPTRRTLFFLVDRDHEKDGVQAWAAPFSKIDQAIVKVSIDRRSGETLPIDDPEEGYDVEFEKNGTGLSTKYEGVAIARRSSPLGSNKWLQYAVDTPLPDALVYFDYDHIAKVFGGGAGGKGGKDHDDRDSRRDDRDRDDTRAGGRNSRDGGGGGRDAHEQAPQYSWVEIHGMSGQELDAFVESEKLDVNPDRAKDDSELADWICEAMGIKQGAGSSRGKDRDADTPGDRLRSMRDQRR